MTTILQVARQNVAFDAQLFHAITGPVPKPPRCKMCSKDTEKPFMRVYNWHYNEAANTCSRRCYHAFMIFYEAIGDTKRKIKDREDNFIAKFERLDSLDKEETATLLDISRAMRTISNKSRIDG